MITKNRGKEVKLDLSNECKIVSGVINSNSPKTIYFKFSTWVEPTDDSPEVNYNQVIRRLQKRIKESLYSNINSNNFKKELTMVDLDLRESGVRYGKRSFMSCEITLFQVNNYLINSEIVQKNIVELSQRILSDVFSKNEYFKFHKRKK